MVVKVAEVEEIACEDGDWRILKFGEDERNIGSFSVVDPEDDEYGMTFTLTQYHVMVVNTEKFLTMTPSEAQQLALWILDTTNYSGKI